MGFNSLSVEKMVNTKSCVLVGANCLLRTAGRLQDIASKIANEIQHGKKELGKNNLSFTQKANTFLALSLNEKMSLLQVLSWDCDLSMLSMQSWKEIQNRIESTVTSVCNSLIIHISNTASSPVSSSRNTLTEFRRRKQRWWNTCNSSSRENRQQAEGQN